MRVIKVIALVSVALATSIAGAVASADDLDAPLAALQRENASLKKLIRIEALEKENAALRKRLNIPARSLPAPAQLEPKAVSLLNSPDAPLPENRGPPLSAEPIALVNWTGPSVGAAFGIGWLATHQADTDDLFYTSQSGTNQYSVAGRFDSDHPQIGAMMKLSLGYDWMPAKNIITGIQAEGGLSNIQARQSGSYQLVSNGFCAGCIPTTITSVTNVNNVDAVAMRWNTSSLFRVGLLLDPQDII
jgi:hypothetical protein